MQESPSPLAAPERIDAQPVESARSGAGDLRHAADAARTQLEAIAVILEPSAARRDTPIVAVGIEQEVADRIAACLAERGVGREIAMIESLAADERARDAFDWQIVGCDSLISVPLHWEGRDLGVLHVLGPRWVHPTSRQRERALAVASHAALAVAFGRLHNRTVRLTEDLDRLLELDEVVLGAETIEEMGGELTARLAVLGVPTGGIMVLDEERGVLQLLPGGFGASLDATASYRVPTDNPISNSARVFMTGEPYLSNGAEGDPGIMQDYVDLFHVERLLSVPLPRDSRRIGVLHLANKPTPFGPLDVHRAEALAARLAVVVELGLTMLRLRRRQRATDVLVDLALGIASGRDIFGLVRTAFERLGDVIGTDVLVLAPPDGTPMIWRRDGIEAAIGEELATDAVQRVSLHPSLAEPTGAGDPGHATLFVPVRLAGKRIATIASMRRRADPFVSTEREVLVRLANLAAVGWATENYQRQRVEVAILRDRQRIADDLHDTVAQIMFAAQIDLDSTLGRDRLDDRDASSILHARSLLLRGDGEIRNVIHQLSRPIRGGLAQRLGLLAEALEEEFGAKTSVRVEVPPPVAEAAKSLRRISADALVKAAQEAITNAAKHGASELITVRVGISRRGRMVLTVIDNGIGRTNGKPVEGYGLGSVRRSLRECGGMLQVRSGPDGGVRVQASVPF